MAWDKKEQDIYLRGKKEGRLQGAKEELGFAKEFIQNNRCCNSFGCDGSLCCDWMLKNIEKRLKELNKKVV